MCIFLTRNNACLSLIFNLFVKYTLKVLVSNFVHFYYISMYMFVLSGDSLQRKNMFSYFVSQIHQFCYATFFYQNKYCSNVISGRTKTVTFSYPEHWKDMEGRKILIVDVNEGSKEWQGVEQIFQKTLKKKILVMKRVQNVHFWEPYSL